MQEETGFGTGASRLAMMMGTGAFVGQCKPPRLQQETVYRCRISLSYIAVTFASHQLRLRSKVGMGGEQAAPGRGSGTARTAALEFWRCVFVLQAKRSQANEREDEGHYRSVGAWHRQESCPVST